MIAKCMLMLFSAMLCAGCSKPPSPISSRDDFEKFYNQTDWYWTKHIGMPEKISGYTIQDNDEMQVFLKTDDGARFTYDELTPSHSFKSFKGNAKLKSITSENKPIFEMEDDYTRRNTNHVLLIGFAGKRVML